MMLTSSLMNVRLYGSGERFVLQAEFVPRSGL